MTEVQQTAAAVASSPASTDGVPGSRVRQYVTFRVGDRAYGVDIRTVREIKQWSPATPLPNQARHMRGVLNLRGTIVPVHDLRAFFGGELTDPTETHVVVIVWIGERTVGILVDAVSDIATVAEDDIRPAPSGERDVDRAAIAGLVPDDDGLVALLDVESLFRGGPGTDG